MARARNIKPSFFTNEALSECEPLARLLFIGLWTIADYKGDLEYRPKRIKAELLPYENCDCEELITQLIRYGFLQKYCVNNADFLRIVNFSKHQNPHKNERARGSDIPEYGAETVDDRQIEINLDKNGTNPNIDETSRADSLNLIPDSLFIDSLEPQFEEFWIAYDYKIDKAPAKKKYKAALKKASAETLIQAARDYREYCKITNTPRKYATTWLNQECWENDYKILKQGVNNGTKQTNGQYHKPSQSEQIESAIARLGERYGIDPSQV